MGFVKVKTIKMSFQMILYGGSEGLILLTAFHSLDYMGLFQSIIRSLLVGHSKYKKPGRAHVNESLLEGLKQRRL